MVILSYILVLYIGVMSATFQISGRVDNMNNLENESDSGGDSGHARLLKSRKAEQEVNQDRYCF